ncbi:BRCT protein [Venustampulla echinocandica]|uniref:BRCT protein n=1 Tax=Venustampulla echinocandica TaxID=2656787 RepID=A0A370TQR1_9HELO|nr:BRCT protein [Venustampulla echinocandica]RDL37860.1 BRCT protein [Venustampulla echinocandica]
MSSAPSGQRAADANFGARYDPWNASSTGHQRSENQSGLAGSTGWRQSRNVKLHHQLISGATGGKRISDTVGVGSEDYDEKAGALIPKAVRQRAKFNVMDMAAGRKANASPTEEGKLTARRKEADVSKGEQALERRKGIFDGLVIYINGSTHPLISDHKLKHALAENGARLSMHLGRRDVTHVILGRPSGSQRSGAGGGLAGTKLQKEIKRVGGCGLKYVGVEWVLESLRLGKRQSETQFSNLKVAAKGQQSVYSMFKKTTTDSGNTESTCTGNIRLLVAFG